MTTEALGFLDDHKDEAFFLYLPYTIPHVQFQVPQLGQYENKSWQQEHKIQAAMISRLDRDCGRILDALKKLGIENNTLVIFTSDNGAHGKSGTLEFFKASGKLRGFKRDLHDGGIRAPFIARWPGRVEAGSTSDHISAFWDMMPTFCELADVKLPQDTDGISMLPMLLGNPKQQKQHKYLYWEWSNSKAVRCGKWKAVESNKSGFELFDLDADISEKNNIAEKHPEIAAKLKAYMTEAHTPLPEYPKGT
jgi:arylsulfatase A-like enzyme